MNHVENTPRSREETGKHEKRVHEDPKIRFISEETREEWDNKISNELRNSMNILRLSIEDDIKRYRVEEEIKRKIREIQVDTSDGNPLLPAEVYITFTRKLEDLGSKIIGLEKGTVDTIDRVRKLVNKEFDKYFIEDVRLSIQIKEEGELKPFNLEGERVTSIGNLIPDEIVNLIDNYARRVYELSTKGDYVHSYTESIRLFNILLPGMIKKTPEAYFNNLASLLRGETGKEVGRAEKIVASIYKPRIRILSIEDKSKKEIRERGRVVHRS